MKRRACTGRGIWLKRDGSESVYTSSNDRAWDKPRAEDRCANVSGLFSKRNALAYSIRLSNVCIS